MIFLICLAILPFVLHPDPAPGLTRSKARSRSLECERMTAEAGDALRPGQVKTSAPRGDYVERSAVICAERLTRPGLRDPLDEAILSSLDGLTGDIAASAAEQRPDLAARTWLVEAYYPSAVVSAKLAFATKNALVAQGLQVSDRTPILSADDVAVLTRLPPAQAYEGACRRYAETGGLGAEHALLAVVHRDPRETILHGGLCVDGQWTWLP